MILGPGFVMAKFEGTRNTSTRCVRKIQGVIGYINNAHLAAGSLQQPAAIRLLPILDTLLRRLKETRKGSGTCDLNLPECIGSAPLSVAQRPIELVPGGGDLVDRGLGREGGGRAGQSGGEGKGKLRHGRSSYFLRPTYASKGGTKRNRVCFWIVRMMR